MRSSQALHATRHRVVRMAAGVVAVLMALLVGALGATSGTYALWSDSAALAPGVTISSGAPSLSVSGFADLSFEYEPSSLSTSAMVTVTNDGNVPIHGFAAIPMLLDGGSAGLQHAISVTFTPLAGGPAVGWADWLTGLTLESGEAVHYTVATSLPGWDAQLIGEAASIVVVVEATAGGPWVLVAQEGFTQAVLDGPESGGDSGMHFDGAGGFDLVVRWENPAGIEPGTNYRLYLTGHDGTTHALPNHGSSTWSPQMTLAHSYLPASLWTANGTVHAATITVVPTSGALAGQVVAQGTIWIRDIGTASAPDFNLFGAPPVY